MPSPVGHCLPSSNGLIEILIRRGVLRAPLTCATVDRCAHTRRDRERLPEGFRSLDSTVDIENIRWGSAMYTPDGKMPPGAPEAVKHFLDVTIPKVRDSKIDLAATWTNEYLPDPK